jgi:hypothetical protein
VTHDGDDVAGHDGVLAVNGVAKEVVEGGGAAVLKDKVHNIAVFWVVILQDNARYVIIMQALQQHFLPQHQNKVLPVYRVNPCQVDPLDNNIQRRATVAAVPNGTIRAAKRPGHNELHASELARKVAMEQVALDLSRRLGVPQRVVAEAAAPNANVVARLHNSIGNAGCEDKVPLLGSDCV